MQSHLPAPMQCGVVSRHSPAILQAAARPAAKRIAGHVGVLGTCSLRPACERVSNRSSHGLEVRAALEGQPLHKVPQRALAAAVFHPAEQRQPTWQRLLQQLTHWAGIMTLGAALFFSVVGAAHAARSSGRVGGSSFGRSSFSCSGSGFSSGHGATASCISSGWGSSSSWGAGTGAFRRSFGSSPLSGGFGSYRGALPSSMGSIRMNSFFLSPFGFGYGYPTVGFGGGGLLSLLFWGAFAVIMLQVVQGVMRNNAGGRDDYSYGSGNTESYDEVVTVGKVQVGLMANARELQRDLERIADRADTESPEGLHYILQETVLALMRNPDYCLYGWAKSKRERSAEDAETAFNQLSLQERTKFEKETRVNVGGRRGRSTLRDKNPYSDGSKELIVVTLLVAADGSFKLPQVDSRASLKQALAMMGAVRADDLLAVEVLWTPEEEDDHFTVEELAYDYPTLNTL